MSALHVYVLRCDAPKCQARFERDLTRADQTRQAAIATGWVHGVLPGMKRSGPAQSLDYCAEHASLGEGLAYKTLPAHAREVAR